MTNRPDATKPLRVASYARVSSTNQVLLHDSSVDTQLTLIRDRSRLEAHFRKSNGQRPWEIVAEYREEGRSGKDTDRPELHRLRGDVQAGRLDAVVVTKVDRITRSLLDFYSLTREFEEHGVEFISLGDNIDTSTASGRAMIKLLLVFAELERERTSERTKEKMQARKRQGLHFGGHTPIGYKPNPDDPTSFLVDDESAEIVRAAFEQLLELGSIRAVVRHLNEKGLRRPTTQSRRGKKRGGNHFATQTVVRMLANRHYIAERILDDGQVVACNWKPIVERDLFDKVQARLSQNRVEKPNGRENAEHVFLLLGLLRCASCGAMMTHASANGRGGRTYFYYACTRKARTAGTGCVTKQVPAADVEAFVLEQLRDYTIDEAAIANAVREANGGRDDVVKGIDAEIERRKSALATAKSAVDRLLAMIEEGEGSAALMERMKQREEEVAVEGMAIREAQARRASAIAHVIELEAVAAAYRDFAKLFEAALVRNAHLELRDLLRSIIEVIEWSEDPKDSKKGQALIQLFPLPVGLQAPKSKQPHDGSWGCLAWLRMPSPSRTLSE
jgi:site-specific DNA recombinase